VSTSTTEASLPLRLTGAGWWGAIGVGLTFVDAVLRLGWHAVRTLRAGLDAMQWCAFVFLAAAFVYGEGHRALQRRFVPAVMARALELSRARSRIHRWLAPFYVAGLVGAPGSVLVRAWASVFLIVLAVLIVRALPEPWRGMTDGAVALALAWGLAALVARLREARRER
jgi:hypothetical protein